MKRKPNTAESATAEKIAALVRTLREAERELQELTGGQLDAVVGVGGGPYLLHEAQEKLRHSEAAQRLLAETQIAILNALPAHIALVDSEGVIVSVNEAWRRFGAANSWQGSDFGVGQNYLTLCDQATGDCSEEAHAVAAGLRAVLRGQSREFAIEYPCHGPDEPRWFRLMITPLYEDRPAGAVVTHINITERKLAELEKQVLVHDLGERVKELRALHGVADLLQGQQFATAELLARVAALLPPAMQYPEVAAARVVFDGVEGATPNFCASARTLHAAFTAAGAPGLVEVVYLTEQSAAAYAPFLKEEQHLIESLADMLRAYFERCAAESALRASESSMAAAQRIAHFGSWELELTNQADINANALRWSDEMFRIAGYEPGSVAVSNELFFQLAHPEDHELIRRAVAEAIRDRRQYSIVHRLIRPGGEVRVVHEVAQISLDDQTGLPKKMVGTTHDITDQRQAEEQLRRTEELYRRAISGAGAVPYAADFKTRAYVFMGEGIRQLIGYEPAEMSPGLWGEIAQEFVMQGEAAGLSREEAARRVLTGQLHHWRCDMRVITRTGETRWIADASVQDRDAAGQPTGALGILQDITERKRAEAELRERESEQRLLAMQLAEVQAVGKLGSWRTDLVTLQVEWSAETYRIFETTPEQFQPTHQAFLQFVHPDDRAEVEAAFAHSIEHRTPCSLEHRLLLPDGRIKHVEERWQTFVDGVGRPLRATGMCRDITERKRAERQVTAFAALGAKLGAAASAEEAARIIVQTADDLLGWDACWLHLYDAAKDQSQSVLNIDIVNDRREAVPPAYEGTAPSPMIRRVLHEGAQLILREQPVVDPAQLAPFGDTARPSASIMIAPVRYDGKVIAVLSIQSYTIRAYRPEDLKALEALADHCGGALARIRAHATSLEAEERYRALFDRSLDAVYLHDLEGHFVDANPAALQLLGYERDDISGLAFADLLADPADLPRARDAIARKLAGDSSEGVTTYALKHRDGARLWVELTSSLVLANGQPVAIQGIARDITARVQAEQALRESDARFQAFMQDSPTVAFMKDTQGRYVYANAATLRLFRITLDQLLGQTDFALLPESVARQLRDNDQRVLATGQPLQTIERVPNEAGELATWQVWKFPFQDSAGGRCVGGLAFDITERQRAEERIAEQAALLDAAHEAIIVKDLEDRIVFWNKGAERLYGWTAAAALGRKCSELLWLEAAGFQTALAELMEHGEWRGELAKRTKAGRTLQVDVRWTLVRDASGQPKSVLAIDSDITEKKQFEAHFLRAQRMESIGTLAGGIAHDLNNVLAPILMAVQVLQDTVTTEEGQAVLATLESSAQRGADLVKQVLAFARGIEGQRLVLNPAHIARDIRKIIHDTFPKNIDLAMETPRDLRTVLGDPTQLHQVLMNLCVNARDAMPQGGKLTITLGNRTIDDVYAGMNPDSKAGDYVLMQVTDTGLGMPADIREKIFEPFFTTKEIGKGTGLGLSTTLAIVKSHGGFINVYSELGKGSQFKVYLPAQTTGSAAEAAVAVPNQLPRGHGELILVVDDEESIRKVAQKTLERFGYRVLLAVNGAEGVSLYAQHREEIAVVLTDMAMPVMDGPTMIIALRNINPAVKIIGSSGLASSDSVSRAVGTDVPNFIPKPYTAESMLRTLAAVLQGSSGAA